MTSRVLVPVLYPFTKMYCGADQSIKFPSSVAKSSRIAFKERNASVVVDQFYFQRYYTCLTCASRGLGGTINKSCKTTTHTALSICQKKEKLSIFFDSESVCTCVSSRRNWKTWSFRKSTSQQRGWVNFAINNLLVPRLLCFALFFETCLLYLFYIAVHLLIILAFALC